jgi:hypothetical protein
MPATAKRAFRRTLATAIAGLFSVVGCGHDDPATTRKPQTTRVDAVAPAETPEPVNLDCTTTGFSETERLRAMLTVQTVVLTLNPDLDHTDPKLVPPSDSVIRTALDTIRCDKGLRASSRHGRAIAKLLGSDWRLRYVGPYLQRLGYPELSDISALQARVVKRYGPEIFDVEAQNPTWAEFAVLRHLTMSESPPGRVAADDSRWLGPSVAFAQPTSSSCWQPEAPPKYYYGPPFVKVAAHVSVDLPADQVKSNVDPQQWDVCGRFWSPPDPANPSNPPLDGAYFAKPQWSPTGPCAKPVEPLDPEDPSTLPEPGTTYGTHYLFERFFIAGPPSAAKALDAWFKNVLGASAFAVPHMLETGVIATAHHIDYWLGMCGTGDNFDGAMDGSIWGNPLKTILDSGYIEVWTENARTHVAVTKTFELSDPVANWLTQLNPAFRELNEQVGEFACCLK